MASRVAILWASLLFLLGCSTLDGYQPFVADVSQPSVLLADESHCLRIAQSYSAPLSIGTIGTAAVEGAGNNLAGAALNPLVPVLGAAGGASSALFTDLDLLSTGQRRVFLRCLDKRSELTHAYVVLDPNL